MSEMQAGVADYPRGVELTFHDGRCLPLETARSLRLDSLLSGTSLRTLDVHGTRYLFERLNMGVAIRPIDVEGEGVDVLILPDGKIYGCGDSSEIDVLISAALLASRAQNNGFGI